MTFLNIYELIFFYIKLFLLSIVGLSVVGFFSHYTIGSDIMSIYWVQFGLFLFYIQESKNHISHNEK